MRKTWNQVCSGDKLKILHLLGFVCSGILRSALEKRIQRRIHFTYPKHSFSDHCFHLWILPTTRKKLVRYVLVCFLKFDKHLTHFILADQLEVIALERLNSPHSGIQISRIDSESESVTALYEVIQTKNVWRLVHRATEVETFKKELVALFQGIICKKDLPPFTERLGYVRPLIVRFTGWYWPTADPIMGPPDTWDKVSQ